MGKTYQLSAKGFDFAQPARPMAERSRSLWHFNLEQFLNQKRRIAPLLIKQVENRMQSLKLRKSPLIECLLANLIARQN